MKVTEGGQVSYKAEKASLDPEGRFVVLQIDSGEPIVETKLEVQPKLERLYVEAYGEKFLIAVNRPPEPAAQRVFVHTPIPAAGGGCGAVRVPLRRLAEKPRLAVGETA